MNPINFQLKELGLTFDTETRPGRVCHRNGSLQRRDLHQHGWLIHVPLSRRLSASRRRVRRRRWVRRRRPAVPGCLHQHARLLSVLVRARIPTWTQRHLFGWVPSVIFNIHVMTKITFLIYSADETIKNELIAFKTLRNAQKNKLKFWNLSTM